MGNVVSFDGYDLRQSGISAFIVGWGGEPSRSNNFSERSRSTSVFSSSRYDVRQFTVAVEFNLSEPTLTEKRRSVVGWFMDNANYDRERMLVIEDNGVTYFRPCAVVKLTEPHRAIVQFEMESASPTWTSATETRLALLTASTTSSTTAHIVTGSSVSIRPVITMNVEDAISPQNQKYTRNYKIYNGASGALRNEPIMLNLGDTSDWVLSGFCASNGSDVEVIIDGRPMRRKLLNFNSMESHLWFVLPYLEPGESVVATVRYGALDSRGEFDLSGFYHPGFSIAGSNGQFRSGSTTSVLQVTPDGTLDLRYAASHLVGGFVKIMDGLNAGQIRRISANTARTSTGTPTITVETPFPYAPSAGETWIAYLSTNTQWFYMVRPEAREGNYADTSGGWYIKDTTSNGPSDIRFGDLVPGAWNRFLLQDNGDDRSQVSNTTISSNRFSILRAQRRRAMDKTLSEEGAYDGVILSSTVPITNLTCDYKIKNPASMTTYGQAKAKILYQLVGGDDWSVLHENSAVYGTETSTAVTSYSLSSSKASQIAFSLVGMNVTKNDEDAIVSVEGDISSSSSSSNVSTFSWGNMLRITRESGVILITDADNPDSVDGDIPVQDGKHEVGFAITVNGGVMLNQALPELAIPASYGETTNGPFHRLVVGPATASPIAQTNNFSMDIDEALVINSKSRSVELWKKAGFLELFTLKNISKINEYPWLIRAYQGDNISKYETNTVASPEILRLGPDSTVRPTGYPASSYVSASNWSAQGYQTYTHTTTTWTGGINAGRIAFTPNGSNTRVVDLTMNQDFRVIPGQVFRWSAELLQPVGYSDDTYVYLAVGWSAINIPDVPATRPAIYPVDRSHVTKIHQYMVSVQRACWQGIVPDKMNYASIYILIYHYGPASSERRVEFGNIAINGEYVTLSGTRDVCWVQLDGRSEFL